jgi:hypothetical protein
LRLCAPIVEYSSCQSTESPSRCQSALKAFSSSAVSATHSSMKFLREMRRAGCLRAASSAISSFNPGSNATPVSQRTWK